MNITKLLINQVVNQQMLKMHEAMLVHKGVTKEYKTNNTKQQSPSVTVLLAEN